MLTEESASAASTRTNGKSKSKSRSRSRSRSTEQTLLAPLYTNKSLKQEQEHIPAKTTNGLWSVKYAPQTIADMCYPTSANKLKTWLLEFARHNALPDSQYSILSNASSNSNSNSISSKGDKFTKAALLSGPPGIGKTTSVYVVARECGYAIVEYNASDFRSRKSLREKVSDVINNTTFASSAQSYVKVLLLMDEVDGCDIGGVGEVIEMIKHTTTIPIVCTCNDRWHPKLRSLMNYVEDIRFIRPPCNIVVNYLCEKILAKEHIELSKPLLQDIIKKAGSDIRNMLNNLQLWCLNRSSLEQRQLAKCAVGSFKNGDVGLFEAAEFFLMQGTSHGEVHTIDEMSICYYNAELIDLFVQENYLHFNPSIVDGRDWMSSVEEAAACMSFGDAAHKMMYNEQNWGAARSFVILSAIAPCLYTRGKYESFATGQQVHFDRQRPVKFPTWLGFNSSSNKNKRLLRLLTMQASNLAHGVSGTQEDVALDYIPLGWELPLTLPLAEHGKDGIAPVMAVMDQYHLMRDDWDFIQTIPHYKRMASLPSFARASPSSSSSLPISAVTSATKTAFTREFNKTHNMENFVKSAIKHVETSHDDDDDDMNDDTKENKNKNNNKNANNKSDENESDEEESNDDMNDEIDKRRAAAIAEMKRKAAMKSKNVSKSTTANKSKSNKKTKKEIDDVNNGSNNNNANASIDKSNSKSSNVKRTAGAGKRQAAVTRTKANTTTTTVSNNNKSKSKATKNNKAKTNAKGKKRNRNDSESESESVGNESNENDDEDDESSFVSSGSDSDSDEEK